MGILAFLIIPSLVSGGSSGTAVVTGNILQSTVAQFTANVSAGIAPLPVKFSDQSTGTLIFWNWDFGDGTTSILQNPVHTYTTPGTYSISLKVTDDNGFSSIVVNTNAITTTLPVPAGLSPVISGDNGGSDNRGILETIIPFVDYLLAPVRTTETAPVSVTRNPEVPPYTPVTGPVSGMLAPVQVPPTSTTIPGFSPTVSFTIGLAFVVAALAIIGSAIVLIPVNSGPVGIYLRSAGNFVILAKSGIMTSGSTKITGDIGVSPIDKSGIKGFELTLDDNNQFSTSSLVTGRIYAADYASPTPDAMTRAINDMETAFHQAAGRIPTAAGLYFGNLGRQTLAPGIYTWPSGVLIASGMDLTLDAGGNSHAIWIFQITGDLTLGTSSHIVLVNGARPENIYWQVAGPTGVTIGHDAHAKGNILSMRQITMGNGATLEGRALAQTTVTLVANTITEPTPKQIRSDR